MVFSRFKGYEFRRHLKKRVKMSAEPAVDKTIAAQQELAANSSKKSAQQLPAVVRTTTETYGAQEKVYEPTTDSRGAEVYKTGGIKGNAPPHDYHFI